MSLEIEAKMRVEDFEPVRAALSRAGASRVGEVVEANVFLDTPAHSLLSAQSGLRLRINHDVATRQESITLTFKGPPAAGELKMREEFEIVVQSAIQTLAILSRL